METREKIGIILMIMGFAVSFFFKKAILMLIVGIFVYGTSRLSLILLFGGLIGMFSPSGFAEDRLQPQSVRYGF